MNCPFNQCDGSGKIPLKSASRKLKLVYVKTPANPKVKPNNIQWSYAFDETGYFCNINRYYGEDEIEF